jgi:hypothetical protein
MNYITLPVEKIPVRYETQLVVLGGGPSGMAAAVNAARCGIDVMMVERCGFMGGQATGGLVIVLCGLNDSNERIIKGFCQETIDYLEHFNATKPWHNFIIFEPEILKKMFDHCIKENNIKLILNSFATGLEKEHQHINYLLAETKSGKIAIKTDFVIDCTGDADTLKWTGEKYEQAPKDQLRPVTACFRVGGVDMPSLNEFITNNKNDFLNLFANSKLDINPMHWAPCVDNHFIWFDTGHITNIDITDVDDLTKGELEARKRGWEIFEFYKDNVKGFENAYIVDIAPLLGVRDSRRLKGKHFITSGDYKHSFDDKICYAPYYFAGKGKIGRLEIPYRALIPQSIKNLLVAGRAISIEHKLIDCIREIPCCYATGQAAGIAASIAIKDGVDAKDISIKKLQDELKRQGAYV